MVNLYQHFSLVVGIMQQTCIIFLEGTKLGSPQWHLFGLLIELHASRVWPWLVYVEPKSQNSVMEAISRSLSLVFVGSEPGKHVYVYFPTINPLRPWENHPFSVLPTALLQANHSGSSSVSDAATTPPAADVEKHDPLREQIKPVPHTDIGLTIYVKRSAGMTRSLSSNDSLPVLLEGPYSSNSNRDILRCDRVLLIAGGIGITGILPFLKNHWNIKLAWSVKESAKCLVDDLDGAMAQLASPDKDVRVGSRINVNQLLAEEITAGWERVGVVVSGPAELCHDVRAAVSAAGRLGRPSSSSK